MNHPTPEQLYDLIDGDTEATSRNAVEAHLRDCPECRKTVGGFKWLGEAIRRAPLERAPEEFTRKVMKELEESSSLAWTILKNLAPFVALLIVAGLVLIILQVSGSFDGSGVQESVRATQSFIDRAGNGASSGITALNGWLGTYFSFAFARSSYGLTVFLIALFGAIALLDKFLFMPRMKRRA